MPIVSSFIITYIVLCSTLLYNIVWYSNKMVLVGAGMDSLILNIIEKTYIMTRMLFNVQYSKVQYCAATKIQFWVQKWIP